MTTTVGNYTLDKELGRGSFSTVKVGRHKITGTRVAIKIVPKSQFQKGDMAVRFQREVKILKDINHPFAAEFFEVVEDAENYYIIMEYVENGNMLDFVNNEGEVSENVARKYFCQLVSVLEYLHVELKVVHRDLKAENVLLDKNYNIRLIDFGLSNLFSNENPFLTTACGSPAYAAPEMVKGQAYTASSDVWSLGILLYAMCAGELPFEDDNIQRLLQKIAYSEPIYPTTFSAQLRDLLHKLLMKDPQKRITLQKTKEHPWFSQYEYSKMMDMNFGVSSQWRVRGSSSEENVDGEIIRQMVGYGIDCSKLTSDLLCGESNSTTACYRMLRKEKITNQMKTLRPGAEPIPGVPLPQKSRCPAPMRPPVPTGQRATCPSPSPANGENQHRGTPVVVPRPRRGSIVDVPKVPHPPVPTSARGPSPAANMQRKQLSMRTQLPSGGAVQPRNRRGSISESYRQKKSLLE